MGTRSTKPSAKPLRAMLALCVLSGAVFTGSTSGVAALPTELLHGIPDRGLNHARLRAR